MINKDISFIEQIKSLLEPMGDVLTPIKGENITFVKDTHVFGKMHMHSDKVLLMNALGDFEHVSAEIISDADEFLRVATESYWIASNKTGFK